MDLTGLSMFGIDMRRGGEITQRRRRIMQEALVAPNATGRRDSLRRAAIRMVRELWATKALGKERPSKTSKIMKLVVEALF